VNEHDKLNWQDWARRVTTASNAEAVPRPRRIPLLPRREIDLFCVDGDGRRFARLFRNVWGRLPFSARRDLLKHWRRKQQLFAGLLDGVGRWRCCFTCHAAWMDDLSDHEVKAVLAGELAYAVCSIDQSDQHATGATCVKQGSRRFKHAVDALVKSWGFDVAAGKRTYRRVATRVGAQSLPRQASSTKEVR